MARSQPLLWAFGCLLLAASAAAQTVIPTSNLYLDSLRTGGVPYRVGNGFYVPKGCRYVVDYNGQCGGRGGFCRPESGECADAQYQGACCPVGYDCQRQSPDYWQCTQGAPTYNLSMGVSTKLEAFQQCGGTPPVNSSFQVDASGRFIGAACPDGYTCTVQNQDYSQCTPNPQTVPTTQSPILGIVSQLGNLITRLSGASSLAPGLAGYNFILPGDKGNKEVDVTVNVTKIEEVISGIFNRNKPPTPSTPPATPPATPPTPPPTFNFTVPNISFKPRPALNISGSTIVDSSGSPVTFHGFNWFGFEVGQTMVDGLYQNYLNPRNFSQVGDFATIVYRQQALGFNAVRLPFRFADLNIAPPKNFTRTCSADSQAQIIGNLTNPTSPYYALNYNNLPFPPPTAPIQPPLDVNSSGYCNAYLPGDTTLNRFLFVIQYFIGNGFYVTIDFHAQGSIEVDRQIVANPSVFQANWLGLLTAIQSLPTWKDGTLPGRLIFDLMNEPDAFNFTWSQPNRNTLGMNTNSSIVPAWGDLYTSTAEALTEQEPALLFFAEGTGQRNQPGTAYGMGFGINSTLYTNTDGLFNALGGLQTILSNPAVKARTVITPHCYGFQVTGWTVGNTNNNAGQSLPFTYYNNFAYLSSTGVPDANGVPQNFPIVIGEFGNSFNSSYNFSQANNSDPLSDQWIHDFAQFSNNLDPTFSAQYPHKNLTTTFWWDWNANSLPPLGLVNADPGDSSVVPANYNGPLQPGWLNIQWVKINNLTDVFNNGLTTPADAIQTGGGWGLRPWYLPPTTH